MENEAGAKYDVLAAGPVEWFGASSASALGNSSTKCHAELRVWEISGHTPDRQVLK